DTGLVGDVTALDAGSLLDEGRAGFGRRLDFARLDGSGVFGVEPARVGIERLHQLVVGNALGRGVKAGTADDDVMHCRSSRIGLDRIGRWSKSPWFTTEPSFPAPLMPAIVHEKLKESVTLRGFQHQELILSMHFRVTDRSVHEGNVFSRLDCRARPDRRA